MNLKNRRRFKQLLAVINSAVFIWIISAIWLSVGGSYYVQHKYCLDKAEKLQDRFRDGINELSNRETYIIDAVERAQNIQQLREMISSNHYVLAEYRNFTRAAILHDLWVIMIDAGLKVSDPSFPESADLPLPPNPTAEILEKREEQEQKKLIYLKYGHAAGDIFSGRVPPNLTDQDIPIIKSYVHQFRSDEPVWYDWNVMPNCSFTVEIDRLFRGLPMKPLKISSQARSSDRKIR